MTNVNKKYLEGNLSNSVWKNFVHKTANIKNKEDFKKIFDKILSPSERILVEKRLAILFLDQKGLNSREIGRILDVSPTTVGFVKNGFVQPKKNNSKENRKRFASRKIEIRKSHSKFPAFVGRGRWRFLNSY